MAYDLIKQDHKTIADLPRTPNSDKHNITEAESKAIKNLRENTNIIIKPTDKSGAVVVMDRSQYV